MRSRLRVEGPLADPLAEFLELLLGVALEVAGTHGTVGGAQRAAVFSFAMWLRIRFTYAIAALRSVARAWGSPARAPSRAPAMCRAYWRPC